jgi:hypothetical protein
VSNVAIAYTSASNSLVAGLITGAGYKNYSFTDGNHMYYDDDDGRCYYVRT